MPSKQHQHETVFYADYDQRILLLIAEGVRVLAPLSRRLENILGPNEIARLTNGLSQIKSLCFNRLQSLKRRGLIHYHRRVGWMLKSEWPECTPWGWVVHQDTPDYENRAVYEKTIREDLDNA